MNGTFGMSRNTTPKHQLEKNHQHKEFNYVGDTKLQNGAGKWRRICKTKFLFLTFTFVMLTLLFFSNFFVEPHPHHSPWHQASVLHWRVAADANVIEPEAVNIQRQVDDKCVSEDQPRSGKDLLPRGIVQQNSNFELQPLGRSFKTKVPYSLLAIAAGIKQKRFVDKIVQKFIAHNFTIILFHYDGVVDKWHDLSWSARAIHIVAINQTKWWFAKRFLHPDVVAPYEYVFLWDEDLGVENFRVDRYLAIMKDEKLEISQPALEPSSSEIHHRITIRRGKYRVHRRSFKPKGNGTLCFSNSTDPPCTGWVEGMAPVFTRDAWKCVWHLIQNDLVHGWGMDFKLGYCAKGDRTKRVGVIDSEYIVHRGIPSLGGPAKSKANAGSGFDARSEIRRRSYAELNIFSQRWRKAVKEDQCWRDPYKHQVYFGNQKQGSPSIP